MTDILNLKKDCLPDNHILQLGPHKVSYLIKTGPVGDLLNGKHVADGLGHALLFSEAPMASKVLALKLAQDAAHMEGRTQRGEYILSDDHQFLRLYGNYVLCDLIAPNGTTTCAIIFIGNEGYTYQHYPSNTLETPEAVLTAFKEMANESVTFDI